MDKRVFVLLLNLFLLGGCQTATSNSQLLADNAALKACGIPTSDELSKRSAKLLFIEAENARLAGELYALSVAYDKPVPQCTKLLALNQITLREAAIRQAELEQSQRELEQGQRQLDALENKKKQSPAQ